MLISEIKNIYVTKLNKFQNQSFSFLGLKSFKIIDPNIFRHVKADQIISVSHPYYFKKHGFTPKVIYHLGLSNFKKRYIKKS